MLTELHSLEDPQIAVACRNNQSPENPAARPNLSSFM